MLVLNIELRYSLSSMPNYLTPHTRKQYKGKPSTLGTKKRDVKNVRSPFKYNYQGKGSNRAQSREKENTQTGFTRKIVSHVLVYFDLRTFLEKY